MQDLLESRAGQVLAPRREIVIRPVATAIPAFLVLPAGIGAEQHAARLERRVQFAEHARQFLGRHVEQRGVGEHAVEAARGQLEAQKILLPDLAAAIGAGHRGEARRAFEADRDVAEFGERLEVAPRPAAEIENRERRLALDVLQQRLDVLAHVVIARAGPEIVGALVVVLQRAARRSRRGPAA